MRSRVPNDDARGFIVSETGEQIGCADYGPHFRFDTCVTQTLRSVQGCDSEPNVADGPIGREVFVGKRDFHLSLGPRYLRLLGLSDRPRSQVVERVEKKNRNRL